MTSGRLVFFDIDGTLWDWNGVIPPSTKEAIRLLKANGHIPIICSGRAKGHIVDKELLGMNFDGIIAACGCHVEYRSNMIYERFIEPSCIEKIINLSFTGNVPIVLEGPKIHLISPKGFEKDDFVFRMYEVMGDNAVQIDADASYGNIKINKFSGDTILSSDYETFKNELSKEFDFIEHGVTPDVKPDSTADPNTIVSVFECVLPGASKGDGIERLCSFLNMNPKDAVAVGDSNNDLQMIEAVGIGVAMGNGSDSIKSIADYVTSDIWDDGIYNAMKYLKLI